MTDAQLMAMRLAICNGSSGDEQLEIAMLDAFLECFSIWKERHRKYGRGNIAEFGATGCLIRSADKKARLREFYIGGKTETPDESIEDSWKDAANYALMGLLCHRKLWPGT